MLLIPYAAQINDGACLPACAQMVLGYLGQPVSQARRPPDTSVASQHTVVVIDIPDDGVYVLDPARDDHPILLAEHAFLAAWIEMDCVFSVLQR